jgi:hypothetical protein
MNRLVCTAVVFAASLSALTASADPPKARAKTAHADADQTALAFHATTGFRF